MRGLKTDRTATVTIEGHAFIQNVRRDQHELGVSRVTATFCAGSSYAWNRHLRCAAAFDELASMI